MFLPQRDITAPSFNLIDDQDKVQVAAQHANPESRKSELGQYFTPTLTARFMASLFSEAFSKNSHLLDAGAGSGILSAAFLDRWFVKRLQGQNIEVTTYEIDPVILQFLSVVLEQYTSKINMYGHAVTIHIMLADFIKEATHLILSSREGVFSHAILNPPYQKIRSHSHCRDTLRLVGIETVNLYAAFVALSILLLKPKGELVAIIPRSFCNGPYYRAFRQQLLRDTAIRHIHLFGSREKAFENEGVLQENVIVYLQKGGKQSSVTISTSTDATFSDYKEYETTFESIVVPNDEESFIRLPNAEKNTHLTLLYAQEGRLQDIGVEVSTGPIVDFRLKSHLSQDLQENCVPLLYPSHFSNYRLRFPDKRGRKPNYIMRNSDTEKWLFPRGCYTVIRRFSSKEEKKRLIASVVSAKEIHSEKIGFENHLNVFHQARQGLPELLAHGLMAYLNSSFLDLFFREFNGHTQVNATDLRQLPYPSRTILDRIGERVLSLDKIGQDAIDTIVAEFL